MADLSLSAKARAPAGAFAFWLTLDTDQYADCQTAGSQFTYTFSGLFASAASEPAPAAFLPAGLGAMALVRRRAGRRARRA